MWCFVHRAHVSQKLDPVLDLPDCTGIDQCAHIDALGGVHAAAVNQVLQSVQVKRLVANLEPAGDTERRESLSMHTRSNLYD